MRAAANGRPPLCVSTVREHCARVLLESDACRHVTATFPRRPCQGGLVPKVTGVAGLAPDGQPSRDRRATVGLAVGPMQVFTVSGRRSGEPRSTPVTPIDL